VYGLPSTSLTQSFNPQDLPEKRAPVCRSMNSGRKHHRVSGTDGSGASEDDDAVRGLALAPESHGWTYWAWAEKRYLVAREPGSLAIFEFVTSEGEEQDIGSGEALPDPMDVYQPVDGAAPYDPEVEREEIEAEEEEEREEREENFTQVYTAFAYTATDASLRKRSVQHKVKRDEVPAPDPESGDGGTIAIGYQRSAHYGLGSVLCWIDDDKEGAKRLDGYWAMKERNMGIVDAVATGLAPGRHRLQCELLPDTLDPLGRREFRLFAVMHD
jgi:hypothetical protein